MLKTVTSLDAGLPEHIAGRMAKEAFPVAVSGRSFVVRDESVS